MRPIRLIPYVCSAGGQTAGSELAGIVLKQAGLSEHMKNAGLPAEWQVDPEEIYAMPYGAKAHENLPPLGTEERKEIVLWHCRYLQEQVVMALQQGARPFTVGGDHAMALGSISGVARAMDAYGGIGVVWIDAHPDFNTPDTSPSQAFHGMPLAALTGRGDPDFVALAGAHEVVDPRKIVLVGIRDIDPGEQRFIEKLGITAFTMKDVENLGIGEVLARARDIVTEGTRATVLSLDIDAFDPEDAPATGTPVAGGLKADSVLPALQKLVSEVDFDLIEITEFNPQLPGRAQTCVLLEKLFMALSPDHQA